MIDEDERQKIIQDIDSDSHPTDYKLGKKYNHSSHSINNIRKEHEAQKLKDEKEGRVDDKGINKIGTQMEGENEISPIMSQVEKIKATKQSKRITEKAKKLLGEEDKVLEKAEQLVDEEKEDKIIKKYIEAEIDPKFKTVYPYTDSTWFTSKMVNELIASRNEKISSLKGEIEQLKIDHADELRQEKAQARSDGRYDGLSEGDMVFCYVCGQLMSKEHLCVPCVNCSTAGYILQAC